MSSLQNAQEARDALFERVSQLKIEAAEAAAIARKAGKADAAEKARIAAELKAQVSRASDELKTAEKALKVAEKEHAKAIKSAAVQAQAMAMASAYSGDPLQAEEVDYYALGKWLADIARNRVCFVEGAGWGEWTGVCWVFSESPSAELLDRVRKAYNKEQTLVVTKLNANAKSAQFILEHAQADLTLPRSLFNRETVAHLVAFQNVTVDLRTGATMAHNPQHYMTGALQCSYNMLARADRIKRTFARFWPGDTETADMFQTVMGYTLTGETEGKITPMLVGNQDSANDNGDNGKSLVQNAMAQVMGLGRGGWGAAVKASLIVDTGDRDANSHDAAKRPLVWRRYGMATEMRKGASVDAGEFNRLSGGDFQTIRLPHAPEGVEVSVFSKVFLSFNTAPRFKTYDKATKTRLCPFPFYQRFYETGTAPEGGQEQEPGLKAWLFSQAGLEALALYAVQGARRYYAYNRGVAGRIPTAASVAKLRDQILLGSNQYADFFDEYLVFTNMADTSKAAISAVFRDYLGYRPKPHETTGVIDALMSSCPIKRVNGVDYFCGVSLNEKGKKVVGYAGVYNPVRLRKDVPTHPANFGLAG